MNYPVAFRDFLKIIKAGNYIILYAVLDDRVHFTMPIENANLCTQKFISDIDEELKAKADNYIGNNIEFYIRMIAGMKTYYRYYPTEDEIILLKQIKIYHELQIREILPGVYKKDEVKFSESDNAINAMAGDNVIFTATKVQ